MVESAAAKTCHERGASQRHGPRHGLGGTKSWRCTRMEIVADGLLFARAQLAINTTLTFTLHCALRRVGTSRLGRHGWCGRQEEERAHIRRWSAPEEGQAPSRACGSPAHPGDLLQCQELNPKQSSEQTLNFQLANLRPPLPKPKISGVVLCGQRR